MAIGGGLRPDLAYGAGGGRDYSSFLFDAMSSIGNVVARNRAEARDATVENRNYARALDQDAYGREQDAADAAFRREELDFRRADSERRYADALEPKPPANFRWNTGRTAYEAIPGSASDPAVIERNAKLRGAATRQRTLPQTTIKALGDAGSGVADVARVKTEFKDEYAGYVSGTAGDIANWAGRNLPGGGGIGSPEAAQWWQDYQAQKNVVRNQLFGSALTATEKAEWEKADINPGMRPEAIKAVLDRKDMIARRAASKLAKAYLSQGYSPETIEGAIGVPLEELGIEAPSADDPATRGDLDQVRQTVESAIARGVDIEDLKAKLLESGIDPADIGLE